MEKWIALVGLFGAIIVSAYFTHVIRRAYFNDKACFPMLIISYITTIALSVMLLFYSEMHFTLDAVSKSQTANNKNIKATIADCVSGNNTTDFIIGENTCSISKKSFKGTKITTVIIDSTKLSKESVMGCLEGSIVAEVTIDLNDYDINTREEYYKKYKDIFSDEDIVGSSLNGTVSVNMGKQRKGLFSWLFG